LEQALQALDVTIFRAVNHGLSRPWLDGFFAFVTDISHFEYVLLPWLIYLVLRGGTHGRRTIVALVLAVALAHLVATPLLKELFARTRPCNALAGVLTPGGRLTSFAFPSGHAATAGSAMLVLTASYRRWAPLWITWGLLVCLSRIYLGLHYPSDVVGGLAVGVSIGAFVPGVLNRLWRTAGAPDTRKLAQAPPA
jgi:undecaprenyl-diphosphatase